MPYGGGASHQQPSCTTVPLGKSVRCALRAAIGMQKKPKDKPKPRNPGRGDPASAGSGSSAELISSFSKEAARKESVVRVVLSSGVVEVYPGVVLACTVIQRHLPGLCLAHPDVFRNPHGAVLRPLEPLFPGQKFLLIPWSTVVKLKQKIPESSIGAFADEDTGSEEATSSPETGEEEDQDQDHSGGAAASAEEERHDSSLMPACSAREYFVARDPWSACRFRRLVEQGLAVEPSREEQPEQRKGKARKKGQKKRKGNSKKRRERRPGPAAGPLRPAGLRALATARRTWEPSLPSVVEEENGGSSELFPSHDRS
ncbi:uncharacterized protein LOC120687469 [Panicum virgatum]|uniref:Uncharacterized protein n=1 Tax=Panicum virgatum TaxID=38727 RepID=A0A8T0MBP4_PANVG|nr:uncharacterized protein LOC120687469 [Panicum virgatum]KAG2533888.1 hypothetical protein PVAP13_9NG006400 [Panicum virgatum]